MYKELIEKVKAARSPEELLALAKENGYALDEEKAKELFETLQDLCELSEEELDNISGGRYGESRKKLQMRSIQWFTSGQYGGLEPIITDEPIVLGRGRIDEGN